MVFDNLTNCLWQWSAEVGGGGGEGVEKKKGCDNTIILIQEWYVIDNSDFRSVRDCMTDLFKTKHTSSVFCCCCLFVCLFFCFFACMRVCVLSLIHI